MQETLTQEDILELNKYLLSSLNQREQDIISRRFGLFNPQKDTLEKIGQDHSLTRERIRQLENAAIKKIKELKDLEQKAENIRAAILAILEEYGGLAEREHLLNSLVALSKQNKGESFDIQEEDNHVNRNNFYFVISEIFDELEEVKNSSKLDRFLKHRDCSVCHLEELIEEALDRIKERDRTLSTSEVMDLFRELEAYKKHKEKLQTPRKINLSKVLDSLAQEDGKEIEKDKIFYSLLKAASDIEQSKLGQWGMRQWSAIKPKTISEKIHLVLKEHGKPMHFREIADKINEISFDKKKANAATVHNELILGDQYVLIGRGIYSLKEWGYKNGTVKDIVKDLLSNGPMKREEIINKVLKQRLVKKNTILLALSDKKMFKKNGDAYELRL